MGLKGQQKIFTTYLKTLCPLAKCIYLAQCITLDKENPSCMIFHWGHSNVGISKDLLRISDGLHRQSEPLE